MSEFPFSDLKRYLRFGPPDEAALRDLQPLVAPHAARIAGAFLTRLAEHQATVAQFIEAGQAGMLRGMITDWVRDLLSGPWDEAWYRRRLGVGRIHVEAGVEQRFLCGAITLVRVELMRIIDEALANDPSRRTVAGEALAKLIDLELATALENYRGVSRGAQERTDPAGASPGQPPSPAGRQAAVAEARYEAVVEKAWSLLTTFDAGGRILVFNRRCEELTGLTRADAIGRDWFDLFVQPAERAAVRNLCDDVRSGRRRGAAWEGLSATCVADTQCRIRWHLTTLPTDEGLPLLCGMGLDVTEDHEQAVRTRRAERLASLGTMAAGLAHEIRNPLNAAHLQLTVVQRRLSRAQGADVPGALGAVDLAASEMQRLAALVEAFLQFARPQPLNFARTDLRSTAQAIAKRLLPESQRAGVGLELAASGPVPAHADDERIKQVLLNLVRNAIEAAGRGGHVRLSVRDGEDGEAHIEVEDDGPGLPSPDAPIFEPFYTTKSDGTGLGLAIVHRIVSDHGGRVGVESRPGRTVFSVHLPAPAR